MKSINRRSALRLAAGTAGCALAASAMPSWAVSEPTSSAASARLRALLAASAAADDALNPLEAARHGRVEGLPPFVDPLSQTYAQTLRANKVREDAALRGISRAALPPIDRVAYDVLSYGNRQTLELFDHELVAIRRQAPLDPSFGLHVEFPDFLTGESLQSLADYERGLKRFVGFDGWLGSVIAGLEEGRSQGRLQSKIIVTNMLAQIDAVLATPIAESPFLAPLKNSKTTFPGASSGPLADRWRDAVTGQVYPGYAKLRDYLRGTYQAVALDAPGRSAMKDGARLYAWELAHHTTTQMSADEIHELGRSEVTRILAEMEQARTKIGFNADLPALFEYVRKDPKFYYSKPEDLLARFKSIEERIWKGIPGLFYDRPRAPFRVAPLPALGDQRGTGYYQGGPADGSGPGTLYFNMSMLNTRPIPTLETLTMHEGIPGHHFQISLTQENAALPTILRFGGFTAYSEGWGLYAESLGPELGMFTDPWQWFGHLDMEMLRAVRLVVDTGIHAKGWSRRQAIDFMLANTSMAPRDVEVEIDRYIANPAQACAYKIGELTLQRLRKQSSRTIGKGFDVRDFHRQVLNTGSIPLQVLEAKIVAWLADRNGLSKNETHS